MSTAPELNPLWDAVVADLGPMHDAVDTDFVLLMSQAVLAMVERAP